MAPDDALQVWVRQLSDGAVAVAVVNMEGKGDAAKVTVNLRDLFRVGAGAASAQV